MSGGSGDPGLTGRELIRRALTVRPSPMVLASSSSHLRWSTSKRWPRPARRLSARARVSSSRAARSAAAITERMSRRSMVEIPARAASARSCHSAAFRTGASCSASARTGSDLIWGRLSLAALRVHALDRSAHARDASLENLSSQGPLLLGKVRQCRLAMDPLGLEAGRPGAGCTSGAPVILVPLVPPALRPPVVAAALTPIVALSIPAGVGVTLSAGATIVAIGASGLAARAVLATVASIAVPATGNPGRSGPSGHGPAARHAGHGRAVASPRNVHRRGRSPGRRGRGGPTATRAWWSPAARRRPRSARVVRWAPDESVG